MNEPIRAFAHNQYSIVRLSITDGLGTIIEKPYKLIEGENVFRCLATYADGTTAPYKAIWTCPMLLSRGGADFYGTFGQLPLEEVRVHASPKHTCYMELACWAWTPVEQTPTGNGEIPHFGIFFDYENIDKLT